MNMPVIDSGELERLADLVRRDDPSLETTRLDPDGKYQTRTVTLGAIRREVTAHLAEQFRRRGAADFPNLYCAWGKCRVGSTALNNLFGAAGLHSYYQPVKTVLRHALVGSTAEPWRIPPAADCPHVFSKETGGPYVLAECLFIPLRALIEAGYPADKLHLILLDREPLSSLASWLHKWSDRVPASRLVHNYVIAALNKQRVENYARQTGIRTTHYVYEASKDSVRSVRILFEQLGLLERFAAHAVTDWNEIGRLDTEQAKIVYPVEPDVYVVPGLHGSDTAYRYHPGRTTALTDSQLNLIARFGIGGVYRASVEACARDLRLPQPTSARLFGCEIADHASETATG